MSRLAKLSLVAFATVSHLGTPQTASAIITRPPCDAPLAERLRAGGCDSVPFTEQEFTPMYLRDQSEPSVPDAPDPAPAPEPEPEPEPV